MALLPNTTLFNQDQINGLTLGIPLGGMPLFTDDLQLLQDATQIYGLTGLLKGWSCVLRGCYVDSVNVSSKTVTITDGIVLINDIVYVFQGVVDMPYPFSIIKGAEVVSSRVFEDSAVRDITVTHSTGIRNSFTFGVASTSLESIMPVDLTEEEIYFDPFTAQRAESVLANLANPRGFVRPLAVNSVVTKSETNKTFIGGTLNYLTGDGEGRWKHFGWKSFNGEEDFILRNSGSGAPAPGIKGGSDTSTLTVLNMAEHTHGSGDIKTLDDGEHGHTWLDGAPSRIKGAREGDPQAGSGIDVVNHTGTDVDSNSGSHIHETEGETDNGTGLNATGAPFSVKNFSLHVNYMNWLGYSEHQSFYKFNTGVLPISNM